MKTKKEMNLITSSTMAIVPLGLLAILRPAGDVLIGLLVLAALVALACMEFRQGTATGAPRDQV
ncbi:MAG: hypothetical protein ACI92G_000378 [Candidatus Pelagisphaera sp.]|jgi:hypothetical protein|tara:strand:+ start:637 stop:828 length:192 start_codon:yes stop_codon:yes gene_type:complete